MFAFESKEGAFNPFCSFLPNKSHSFPHTDRARDNFKRNDDIPLPPSPCMVSFGTGGKAKNFFFGCCDGSKSPVDFGFHRANLIDALLVVAGVAVVGLEVAAAVLSLVRINDASS